MGVLCNNFDISAFRRFWRVVQSGFEHNRGRPRPQTETKTVTTIKPKQRVVISNKYSGQGEEGDIKVIQQSQEVVIVLFCCCAAWIH